jgi:hypothetical protein
VSTGASATAGDSITPLVDLVSWDEGSSPALFSRLEEEYAAAVAERLGVVLAHLIVSASEGASELQAQLGRLDSDRFEAFLLAPETSRRVVLEHLHPLPETAEALTRLGAGETVGAGPALREVARFEDGAPVLVDAGAEVADSGQVAAEVDRVMRLRALLEAGAPATARTTAASMRELVLRFEGPGAGFRSNSPQGYVGRAVLNNSPDADDVALLEALVHEPIHGLVGMSEAIGLVREGHAARWVYDDQLYDGESRTVSPWSGVGLDLPTYLQACFVWYGLLQFWTSLYPSEALDGDRVRNRIMRSLSGFVDDGALEQLQPHRGSINPLIFDAVAEMCAAVQGSLQEQVG